jgi:RNA polymerase sigma-32 factor
MARYLLGKMPKRILLRVPWWLSSHAAVKGFDGRVCDFRKHADPEKQWFVYRGEPSSEPVRSANQDELTKSKPIEIWSLTPATYSHLRGFVMEFQQINEALVNYIASLQDFSILSKAEEAELARRFKLTHDRRVQRTLVTSNLRFVVKIAMQYRGYNLPLMDLVQEGNMGLMKAVERFDPDLGCRLISYAIWWIKAYIHSYVLRSWSLVKIGTTQAQRRLFFRRSDLPDISEIETHQEELAEIATSLRIEIDDVIDIIARLRGQDVSLDQELGEMGGSLWVDSIPDETPNQEELLGAFQDYRSAKSHLEEAVETLSHREKFIIRKRSLSDDPWTLKEVGAAFGVSRERARQIEEAALEKLRDYFEAQQIDGAELN